MHLTDALSAAVAPGGWVLDGVALRLGMESRQ